MFPITTIKAPVDAIARADSTDAHSSNPATNPKRNKANPIRIKMAGNIPTLTTNTFP